MSSKGCRTCAELRLTLAKGPEIKVRSRQHAHAEKGVEFRKRWCINVLKASTPQLLAQCMLTLYDALRPAVAAQLLSERWNFMDVELVPGGLAILDPVRSLPAHAV